LLPTVGYVSIETGIEKIAEMLIKKLSSKEAPADTTKRF
jgi:hypothetical protein